jgi:hypothetical protein
MFPADVQKRRPTSRHLFEQPMVACDGRGDPAAGLRGSYPEEKQEAVEMRGRGIHSPRSWAATNRRGGLRSRT